MKALLAPYRLPEALLITSFTIIGSVMAAPALPYLIEVGVIAGLVASYLLIVSIYAFNSWAGLRDDAANPRLAVDGFATARAYATVTALTLAAALSIFAFLRPVAIPYALGVFFLWGLYSFPRYGAKYVPLAGTILHVAVGITQFQQGWALIGEPDDRSLFLSLYFALLLAAGHVNHELIDHDADKRAGIVSGAVRFGTQRWVIIHLGATLAALVTLGMLAITGEDPLRLTPFLVASAGHVLSASFLIAGRHDTDRFLRHRARYRLLFAGAGIVFLAGSLYG
ncbi:MAG TPA: UbiA family prenyltransferase [bacterium]|nr:UbiA family prenyltransferase [bacterium]